MSKRTLIAGLLMLCLATRSFATDCEDLAKAADLAIAEQKKAIEIRDLRLDLAKERLEEVSKERDELRGTAWYKSPYLWLSVGILAGAYVSKR